MVKYGEGWIVLHLVARIAGMQQKLIHFGLYIPREAQLSKGSEEHEIHHKSREITKMIWLHSLKLTFEAPDIVLQSHGFSGGFF